MANMRAPLAPWKIAIVGALALAMLGVGIAKRSAVERPATAKTVPVRIERPARTTLEKTIRLGGSIDAEGTVTVVPKVSGTVVSLEACVGQSVRAGQVLARVDPEPYRIALDQARIARDAARSEFERAAKLVESGSVSRQAYEQAQSRKDSAEAQFELASINFDNTLVKAPVSGTVVQRSGTEGALASPSTPLFTVTAAGETLVAVKVPEQYARPFMDGTVGWGTVSVPSAGIDGARAFVRDAAPFVKSDTRTFEVTCALDGDARTLLPGMYVNVSFALDSREGVPSLPVTALSGDSTLWILDRATMTGRPVDVGTAFSDGERIEVPSEYADAEFIVEGQRFLREDSLVRVLGDGDGGEGDR
jgi:RND family efflux transporter MFP subunit